MILLVSGTLWGTYIPGMIVRTAIFNAGYTWQDIDSRHYLWPAIVLRVATCMYSFVSSAVNPIIYYYSRKDLKKAFFTIIGYKTTMVPQQ